jgi:hypothetical protein
MVPTPMPATESNFITGTFVLAFVHRRDSRIFRVAFLARISLVVTDAYHPADRH